MRKIISLGLFALMLSIFSGQVLAGNADEFCGPLKNKGADDYMPGLYGLCVAWHNADEKAKVKIGDKFYARAGFEVPRPIIKEPEPDSDFSCPCWDTFTFKEVCELGKPTAALSVSGKSAAVAYLDTSTYVAELFGAGISVVAEEGNVCEHGFQDLFSQEFDPSTYDREERLEDEEFEACLAEAEAMFTLYLEDCETL